MNMAVVLRALTPLALAAVYFYGWRALAVLAVTNTFAFLTEWYFTRGRGEPVTLAVFVTGSLLALSLPPNIPFWMCALGAVVAVTFGKELFGGMGRNIYNPALVGRAFLFVAFPREMTGQWFAPFTSGAGGLAQWAATDAITGATPLGLLSDGSGAELLHLLVGMEAGCLGETSAILILLAALYMTRKKIASWEIIISVLGSYLVFATGFWLMGWGGATDPLQGLLAGGLLYGAVFMATDPVSACPTRQGKVAFGIIIGFTATLIRYLGNFPEGMMFAILIGNTFGPIAEEGLKNWSTRRAARKAASQPAEQTP
jgi:Na+-transporting NADH:ubiquinone oxidoreductase subunit B